MSELTSSKRHGNLGRTLLWFALALTVLLLGFVTAISIRANPYYSDAAANGVSKFKFLEECRKEIGRAQQLTALQGVLQQNGRLRPGQRLRADLGGTPSELVNNTESLPGGGWSLSGPANVGIEGQTAVLGQLGAQCVHEKASGRTVAQLQLSGGGQ